MLTNLKASVKELLQLFVPGKAQVTFLKLPAGWVISAATVAVSKFLG
jgi:hypothetical protein